MLQASIATLFSTIPQLEQEGTAILPSTPYPIVSKSMRTAIATKELQERQSYIQSNHWLFQDKAQ